MKRERRDGLLTPEHSLARSCCPSCAPERLRTIRYGRSAARCCLAVLERTDADFLHRPTRRSSQLDELGSRGYADERERTQ